MKLKNIPSLILAALLLLSLTACGGMEEPVVTAPVGIAVEVEAVTMDAISTEHRVSGQVAVENSSTIMLTSPAKCSAVYFQAGDTVKEGDIICTLELEGALATYNAASIG